MSAPVLKIYRRCDTRAKLVRSVIIGDCLSPEIPDGTQCWFEVDGAWQHGELCLLFDPRDGHHGIKQMHRMPGGRWLMLSNLPAVWLTCQQVIGPLVRALFDDPHRPRFPDRTRETIAGNARFRALYDEELNRRRARQARK